MRRMLSSICLIGFATPALSHVPAGGGESFIAGILHPLFGVDHILAMVAVGLWASLFRGFGLLVVPASFIVAMVAGFILALIHIPIPMVEPVILASTIVLGIAVALAFRCDYRVCVLLSGSFALFHGYAHGSEVGEVSALRFGVGFVFATVLLHGAGVGIGLVFGRSGWGFKKYDDFVPRVLGAATALIGMGIVMG